MAQMMSLTCYETDFCLNEISNSSKNSSTWVSGPDYELSLILTEFLWKETGFSVAFSMVSFLRYKTFYLPSSSSCQNFNWGIWVKIEFAQKFIAGFGSPFWHSATEIIWAILFVIPSPQKTPGWRGATSSESLYVGRWGSVLWYCSCRLPPLQDILRLAIVLLDCGWGAFVCPCAGVWSVVASSQRRWIIFLDRVIE